MESTPSASSLWRSITTCRSSLSLDEYDRYTLSFSDTRLLSFLSYAFLYVYHYCSWYSLIVLHSCVPDSSYILLLIVMPYSLCLSHVFVIITNVIFKELYTSGEVYKDRERCSIITILRYTNKAFTSKAPLYQNFFTACTYTGSPHIVTFWRTSIGVNFLTNY